MHREGKGLIALRRKGGSGRVRTFRFWAWASLVRGGTGVQPHATIRGSFAPSANGAIFILGPMRASGSLPRASLAWRKAKTYRAPLRIPTDASLRDRLTLIELDRKVQVETALAGITGTAGLWAP